MMTKKENTTNHNMDINNERKNCDKKHKVIVGI